MCKKHQVCMSVSVLYQMLLDFDKVSSGCVKSFNLCVLKLTGLCQLKYSNSLIGLGALRGINYDIYLLRSE